MNDHAQPPRIDGDGSEPAPACERTPETAQGNLGPLSDRIAAVLMEILSAFANDLKMTQREHAELGAARILAAVQPRTITTVEQLDALPFLSIIREVYGPSPSGCDYGSVWERRTSGWHCIAGSLMPPGSSPRLGSRVLYIPEDTQ